MKIKLTDISVRSIKPNPAARIELSDTERSGLRFRMSPKGNASWLYQKKIKGGTHRGFKLGSYPAMSLAQARSAALEIQIEAESGVDRVLTEEDAKARLAADGLKARSVEEVLELYVATYLQQELKAGQSREERTRQLRTYLAPYSSKFIGALTYRSSWMASRPRVRLLWPTVFALLSAPLQGGPTGEVICLKM